MRCSWLFFVVLFSCTHPPTPKQPTPKQQRPASAIDALEPWLVECRWDCEAVFWDGYQEELQFYREHPNAKVPLVDDQFYPSQSTRDDDVTLRWLITIAKTNDTLPDERPNEALLERLARQLSTTQLVRYAASASDMTPGWPDTQAPIMKVYSRLVEEPLQKISLEERCAMAKILAKKTVQIKEWMGSLDRHLDQGVAYLWLPSLVYPGEICEIEVNLTTVSSGHVKARIEGTDKRRSAPYLLLDLVLNWKPGETPQRLTFEWKLCESYLGNDPCAPGQPCVTEGRPDILAVTPTIKISLARGKKEIHVTQAEVTMWVESLDF